MESSETKEDGDAAEDWPSSPYQVLHAVKLAGEALQNVKMGGSSIQPSSARHKRTQSEHVAAATKRSLSFQKLKSHVQRAWRWGNNPREQSGASSFNPEVLANQKRQWYQLHSKISDLKKYQDPTSLFEHFVVLGLHPDANLEVVEDAFAKRKKWELEMEKNEMIDLKMLQYGNPQHPTLEPQILFKYPPGKRLSMRPNDLAAFCFPGGVKARIMEKTPSLSDLNEVVYGQEHLSRDDSSFIFSLKVANRATLYGVCLHVQEMVQRPPSILGASSPISRSSGGPSRFLVSAPRCYCVLTRVPFFELHYEMLKSIIAQDRLNRITEFVNEMNIHECVSSSTRFSDTTNDMDSPCGEYCTNWTASAIPVDSAVALAAAAAGIISEDEVPSSSSRWESPSPGSAISETSDHSQTREIEKRARKDLHYFDDYVSESSETHSDILERMNGGCDNFHNPESGQSIWRRSRTLDCLESSDSLFSPARSTGSEDEDEETSISHEREAEDEITMEWARENKNELLLIVHRYHAMPIPPRGGEIVFQPLEHLQPFVYRRPLVSTLGVTEKYLDQTLEFTEVNLKLAAAEEALALSIWATATICRALSLESVLAFVAGVLLEKQLVIVCPNLGILSAVVLSIIPMIRPFEWQSLFLPVLPGKMLDFLDAPVPFVVGLQHKPTDWKMKISTLFHINVVKDQVKTCHLPALPRHKELMSELRPIHARLFCENSIAKRCPVYKCNEVQAEAAAQFLMVMRCYLESLCSDLRAHTITSVQSNNDRVSLLLKDSFIDSFPSKDQAFVKLFVDTQLFTVLSDSRLSCYESQS